MNFQLINDISKLFQILFSLSPSFANECESLNAGHLPTFPNKVLSNLLAAHPSLCDNKFELKINDIRFVGHPLRCELDSIIDMSQTNRNSFEL